MFGAFGGIRTPNLLIRSQMLYPLSYERVNCDDNLTGVLGALPQRCVWRRRRDLNPRTQFPKSTH